MSHVKLIQYLLNKENPPTCDLCKIQLIMERIIVQWQKIHRE